MSEIVINAAEFITGLNNSITEFEKKWSARNRLLINEGMKRLVAKTPVHTGQTVRSYVASNGAALSAAKSGFGIPDERTNALPLGPERFRGPATAEALATLAQVDFSNPYDVFFISNRSPSVAGLEEGSLPGPPLRSRSPAGMFGVTLQELTAMLDLGIV